MVNKGYHGLLEDRACLAVLAHDKLRLLCCELRALLSTEFPALCFFYNGCIQQTRWKYAELINAGDLKVTYMFFFPLHIHKCTCRHTQAHSPYSHSPASTKSAEMAFSSLKQNLLAMCSFQQTKCRLSLRKMLSYGFLILSIKCLNLSVGENILSDSENTPQESPVLQFNPQQAASDLHLCRRAKFKAQYPSRTWRSLLKDALLNGVFLSRTSKGVSMGYAANGATNLPVDQLRTGQSLGQSRRQSLQPQGTKTGFTEQFLAVLYLAK